MFGQHEDALNQQGSILTTAQGVPIPDTDHSLKAGRRGPTLLEDFHFREKIMHFDHERIPERVVHARGAGAHGIFTANGKAAELTTAAFLAEPGETDVFVRFSTVLGSRGSADTVRDVRGFATKFYTKEGVFDLVGNNIPVFFIQDALKFPDLVHASKPHPDREIPQATAAHDTFWDFVSLHTEAMHTVTWAMSDRGIPLSFRTMQGFGVHTFRLVNSRGETCLVKFHWMPELGTHAMVWEEAQLAAGMDPDLHRRDLADAIDAGNLPTWQLGVQVFPDTPEQTFEGIDLLDATKVVPEELAPVQVIGTMTLRANPDNFFAETEQVAVHPGHLVTGIEATDDPLLQGRMFSYLDTQLSRLGGPNFSQLPINRPRSPVNDNLRDGMHQTAIPKGIAPYLPTNLDTHEPDVASVGEGAYVTQPRALSGEVTREDGDLSDLVSFGDHFTQAAMYYRSLSRVEQEHTASAFTFELGKCSEVKVRERVLTVLADIDTELCESVAAGLGLPAPAGNPPGDTPDASAFSIVATTPGPVAGRTVGVVCSDTTSLADIAELREQLQPVGVSVAVIAPHGGELTDGDTTEPIHGSFDLVRSIEFDAVAVAGGTSAVENPKAVILLQEAFRHFKPLLVWGDGGALLTRADIDVRAEGVSQGDGVLDGIPEFLRALGMHRVWGRS